ncbi:cytochrome c oxidase subunit II [Brasilonema octagenarum UFV-E1]|uniref:Cytochrome c oxidase subunit 2 n=1 Tax=Brasilonema sennae CENA114 TaxID=415709 RepID=A0A856MCS2_9CYAN|nr:cytochrome c oxidase subunit II [Brasilonema sennae]QDL06776.1 cytochrome c oxidase subunit II [Brasilonema sennae CENA114]QDL13145.1 cytochrome c oxidase subunit II [Brasilonema octagenarum UFV-E1]
MRTFNITLLAIFVGVIILTSHAMGQQAYHWLPIAAAAEAEPVGHLFSFLVTLGTIVFLSVMGVLVYSILFYRASDTSDAPAIRGNLKLEITWTVIPILLVIWIAGYSYNIYQRMNILGSLPLVHLHLLESPAYAETGSSNMQPTEQIEVIAKQWSWSFHYPSQNVTSTELHIRVNRPVHLMLKSEDVVHGFYVPNFRIKQDIVPNQTIAFKFTPNRIGQYQLHDSQFSGTYFALMEANVFVDSPERYNQWLAQAATRPSVPAINPAKSEHSQPPKTPLRSNWHTVPPAQPPVVNK